MPAQTVDPPGRGRTVLVGFAEALAAPESIWSLEDAGFRVHAFTRRGARAPVRHLSSVELLSVTAPEESVERTVDDLHRLITAHRPDALLPLDDASLLVAGRLGPVGTTALVGPGDGECLELALDKRLQVEAATRAGFAVPATVVAEKGQPITAGRGFPCIAKPAAAAGIVDDRLWRGSARTCTGAAALDEAIESLSRAGPVLIQELLTGVGEGIFGLARNGEATCFSAHRRVRMMNPEGSGSSACISTVPDAEALRSAERMIAEARWTGLFMIELLRDASGRLHFIELNGRPWGSMALARRAGFEYPAWATLAALGEPLPEPAPPPVAGLTARHLGRDLVHLLFVLRGKGDHPAWPSRSRSVADVLVPQRGERLYNWRRGHLGLLADDTVSTVVAALRRRAG